MWSFHKCAKVSSCDLLHCGGHQLALDPVLLGQYNTIQYSTAQYNTIQYNTLQYNTIQYNTIQYNTDSYNYDELTNKICLKIIAKLNPSPVVDTVFSSNPPTNLHT